jgi:hypothetical protein
VPSKHVNANADHHGQPVRSLSRRNPRSTANFGVRRRNDGRRLALRPLATHAFAVGPPPCGAISSA